MKLSKRLNAICDFVPEKAKVIDVGADHALTDIYLTKYKNCICLATDISEKAIMQAKNNIKKYNLKIKTKVTNGLNDIKLKDEIIIISGMGAHTITEILNKEITNDLIISSNNNVHLIRKFMQNKGYHIENETVIFEKHYYVITYYKYGKAKKTNNIISPFLKNDKQYMNHLSKYYKMKSQKETNIIKKLKYKYLYIKIKSR